MMFTISVKTNVKPTVDWLNRISKGIGDRSIVSALNKTIAQVNTRMARAITAEYNIKSADVKARLRVQRARRAGLAFTATLQGNAGSGKRAMNMVYFLERKVTLAEAKRRRRGGTLRDLRFKVRKRGGVKTVKGAFLLNVPGSPVMRRTGTGRSDFEPLRTIGVPSMFQAKKVQVPEQRWIDANFPRIFDREWRYFLSTVK